MKVKIARIKKGITQVELCKLVKTSPRKIVEIERGINDNTSLRLMRAISKVLGESIEYLFLSDEV